MSSLWKGRRPMVVIDPSRGPIKLAAAEAAGEAVRFHGITRIPLSSEESERGEVDPREIADRIGAEVGRRGWQGMRAACLLSGSATSTQSFLFPSMPAGELREALALKMAETLHFDLAQAHFAFRPIRQLETAGKKQVLILATAVRKDAIEQALAMMRAAGLQPVAIGSAAESLANLAYYARLCREDEASIHVDMGSFSTILNLFEGRWLRFTREINTAGEAFTRALMRPILTSQGPVRLTRQQAEEVKLAGGYPLGDLKLELPHGVRPSEILPLMDPVAQRLTGEIRRSIDYLCGILERLRVDRIVLSGRGGQMRNLDTVLQENLNTPVVFMDPVARAKAHWRLAICDEAPPPLAGFSAILGYSLGNHPPINLMPREEQVQQMRRRFTTVGAGIASGALPLGVCLALAAVPIRGIYGSANVAMRRTADRLDERLNREASFAQKLERVGKLAEEVIAARGPVPDWTGLMKELAALLPREAQLTEFSVKRGQNGLTAHLEASIHQANVPFEMLVSQMIGALGDSPFFRNVHGIEASRTGAGSAGRFEATLEIVAVPSHAWGARP